MTSREPEWTHHGRDRYGASATHRNGMHVAIVEESGILEVARAADVADHEIPLSVIARLMAECGIEVRP
jgi:hypothetical protein